MSERSVVLRLLLGDVMLGRTVAEAVSSEGPSTLLSEDDDATSRRR